MIDHFNKKIIKCTIFVIFFAVFGFSVLSVIDITTNKIDQSAHKTKQHTAKGKDEIFNNHAFVKAPPFKLPDTENQMIDLHEYRGQSVLVNVWTTWCKECQEDMVSLQKISQKYSNSQLQILAVNMTTEETSAKAVQNYLVKNPITFPVLLDKKGKVKKDYHVFGIPTSFLIDPYGRIIKTFRGVVTTKDIQNWLPQ
ncbi:TlpA disulfide reductase family protein [Scopulibacillus cellulosilyticus]|uniref:TlpA disulfide reductase family protein n=1 Tax=Scopulibacillus cellulosilyticus TaxID=2665665 RepID=A0ABW2Q0C8_9BACL